MHSPFEATIAKVTSVFPQTEVWTDSFREEDIDYGIVNGSVGVTTSPVNTAKLLLADEPVWTERLYALTRASQRSESELLAAFDIRSRNRKVKESILPFFRPYSTSGRFCLQTNIYNFRNVERIVEQAREIIALGSNFQVKVPTTDAGLVAMEQLVYEGVSVMATTCLSVSLGLLPQQRPLKGVSFEGSTKAKALNQLRRSALCRWLVRISASRTM